MSQEKEIMRKREQFFLGICQKFENTSCLTNIILICKFKILQTIPIPICTEVGFAILFLFLQVTVKTVIRPSH